MQERAGKRRLFSMLVGAHQVFQSWNLSAAIRRLPLAYSAYSFLYQQWVPRDEFWVKVDGNRLFLDPEDMGLSRALILSGGKWECGESEVFCARLHQGMTVVDVGAHAGYYTLLAARRVGSEGRVFAFEPNPRNFAFLRTNIEASGYGNAVLVDKAVYDRSGSVGFEIQPSSSGDGRICPERPSPQSTAVETVSLDEFFASTPRRVDFVKIDAEGAEPFILAGMRQLIRRNPRIELLTEFSPSAIRALGNSPEAFLSGLRSCGFSIYPIRENGRPPEALGSDGDGRLCASISTINLLCLPASAAGFAEAAR